MTAAVERALAEAAAWTEPPGGRIDAPALLLGLLAESECRAALLLAEYGIDQRAVCQRWPELKRRTLPCEAQHSPPERGFSPEAAQPAKLSRSLEWSWALAAARLADCPQPVVFGTEHILLALAGAEHEVALWLREKGVDPDVLDAQIHQQYGCYLPAPSEADAEPLEMPDEEPPAQARAKEPAGGAREVGRFAPESPPAVLTDEGPTSNSAVLPMAVLRILDAAANRAREGLRVVEDYARFVLDDRHLTEQLKSLRHALTSTLGVVPLGHRLAARETQADVGTGLSTPSERLRIDAADVATANFARIQESLRSLEEFGKIVGPEVSARIEQLRYRAYTLQRAVEITRTSIARLERARLYVLIDGRATPEEFESLVRALVAAGVHAIQLRDKRLDDRQMLQRARSLREMTRGAGVLCVVNDRPDLAAATHADGVHVGQEELPVKEVRAIVGPDALIGVSAHSIEQARQAVLDGANYLGVGPTFPSTTKHFDQFPGLDLLRAVAAEIRLPAFAIGGIDRDNLAQVLSTGVARIAVSGAVCNAADPGAAVRDLLERLWHPRD
ncbi:MAG: thiamine phosphate synthase [Thermoguttaceae bacterium]|nr:thiamine phosphate synthase [Thermoguttaceae bacterium]